MITKGVFVLGVSAFCTRLCNRDSYCRRGLYS